MLAIPINTQAASDFLVSRGQLLDLRKPVDIGFAKEFDVGTESSQRGFEIRSRPSESEQTSRQAHLLFVESRKNLHGKPEIRPFGSGVGSIACIRNHGQRTGFANQRVEA